MNISAFAVAALVSLASLAHAEPAVKVGQPAPDFTLTDTQGKPRSLGALKGKYVVLEWTNPECPFVRKHYGSGNMQKVQRAAGAKGVFWLSINSSAQGLEGSLTDEQENELLKKTGAKPSAVALDHDGKVGRLYGAKATPTMFVIDPQGKVIYAGAIDDKPSPDPKTVASAKNFVLAALDAAMAGKPVETPLTRAYGCSVKYKD